MFGCIPKNALENILQCLVVLLKMLQKTYFYHVSHIFLGSKQILLQRIKIYKQHKKQKSKQKNQNHKTNHERGTKRDRFVGVTRWWTRWVDLKVASRFRSGSLTRWVDRFVSSWGDLVVGQGGLIGGWVRGAISSVLGCDSPVLGSVWVDRLDRCDGWIRWTE